MARYIGPKSKIARKFGEPIFGPDKHLERKNYPPGQHGLNKRRKKDFGIWCSAEGEAEGKIYLWVAGKTIPQSFRKSFTQ